MRIHTHKKETAARPGILKMLKEVENEAKNGAHQDSRKRKHEYKPKEEEKEL